MVLADRLGRNFPRKFTIPKTRRIRITCQDSEATDQQPATMTPPQLRESHSNLSSCEAVLTQKLKSLELQNSLSGSTDLGYHKSLALLPAYASQHPSESGPGRAGHRTAGGGDAADSTGISRRACTCAGCDSTHFAGSLSPKSFISVTPNLHFF